MFKAMLAEFGDREKRFPFLRKGLFLQDKTTEPPLSVLRCRITGRERGSLGGKGLTFKNDLRCH